MKKWICLSLMVGGIMPASASDVCGDPEYKQVCDRAVSLSKFKIQPYIKRAYRLIPDNGRIEHGRLVYPLMPFRFVPDWGIPGLHQDGILMPATCPNEPNCISEDAGQAVVPATVSGTANGLLKARDIEALKDITLNDLPDIPEGMDPCLHPELQPVCEKSIRRGMIILKMFGVDKGLAGEVGKMVVGSIVTEAVHAIVEHVKEKRELARKEEAARPRAETHPSNPPLRRERMERPRDIDPEPIPHPTAE